MPRQGAEGRKKNNFLLRRNIMLYRGSIPSSENMKVNENLCCVRILKEGVSKGYFSGHGSDLSLIKKALISTETCSIQ